MGWVDRFGGSFDAENRRFQIQQTRALNPKNSTYYRDMETFFDRNLKKKTLNKKYKDTWAVGAASQKTLRPLVNGDHVRKLEMTFKDQVENKKKGYEEKWSRKVFQVMGKHALRRNPKVYRYSIGDPKRTYYRHELLWIPKEVDQDVLQIPSTGSYQVLDYYKP